MAKASPNWQRSLAILTSIVGTVVVIGCLYWAQAVFIPLTLAVYLTLLLNPFVSFLKRRRIDRIPAVLLVVTAVALLLGSVGWIVTNQFSSLVRELPQYKANIQEKVQSLRKATAGMPFEAIRRMAKEIAGGPEPRPVAPNADHSGSASSDPSSTSAAPERTSPIVIEPESPSWLIRLPTIISSLGEAFGAFALTFVLVIFMLLKREDLRNRMIRLIGHGQIALTTKALDDAAQRISRFLLIQAISNGGFGLLMAIGLFLIGIPYVVLWGFLAALLRYLPYVGTVIAAILPLTVSLATSEGWLSPLMVLALFGGIELLYSNLLEPRIFGQSMGVSEVALLISAALWAFLWGPVGLVLSNPLTVCLVVLGKYVPQMEFFTVLLGDEPALAPNISYYQRLLARDRDEAIGLVESHARNSPPEEIYDELLIPALTFAKRDRERDELTDDDEQFIFGATREIIAEIGERPAVGSPAEAAAQSASESQPTALQKVRVFGCPARDEGDDLALEMFRQLLDPAKWEMDVASTELLSAEIVALADRERPALICISSLPPGGLSQARYLCKRLRAKLPEAKILVGRWGLKSGLEQNQQQLREAGADEIDTTLLATRKSLGAWYPVLAQLAKNSPFNETIALPRP